MANKLKHLSSATAGNTPPSGAAVDRGRIAFNLTDRKLWGYSASGTAQLIASLTTDHSAASAYCIGDLAVQGGVLYRCTANIPPKTFSAADWATVSDFRAELLYRAPTTAAQARMTMAAAAVGLRVRAHASQSGALTAWETSGGTVVSDIRADGYPGAAFGRPVFRVDQVAHGFTAVGQPVRFNGTNWVLADASVAGGKTIAVVHKVLGANAVELQTGGRLDGLQAGAFVGGTIAANTRYYLSVANPGQLTSTPPPDAADENVVLHTLTTSEAIINLQVPVGGGGASAGGSTLVITQSPNPFTAVGQVAGVGSSGWALANPATGVIPVGVISATAGNDFAVTLGGEVEDIVAGAAAVFPLVAGTIYFSTTAGLLTATPPTTSALGAGPVLVATSGSSGVVIAGQTTSNTLRASQNLSDLASVGTAITNLGLDDVVRTSRQVNSGTGLTGGGNLSANRTLALSAASIASLGLADTAVQPARTINTGNGITGGGDLSANRTLTLTGQALALHNFENTGFIVRTGAATYTSRAFAAGDGISVTNGTGIGGNPTYAVDSTVVRTSRTLTAGDGLTGGGNLGADRTFAVNSTVVRTSGAQSIGGVKTFTSAPNMGGNKVTGLANGTDATDAVARGQLGTAAFSNDYDDLDGTPPELTPEQIIDPDDDTKGLVSGEDLAASFDERNMPLIASWEHTAGVSEIDFVDLAGWDEFYIDIVRLVRGGGSNTDLRLRVSDDNGSTFFSTGYAGRGVTRNQGWTINNSSTEGGAAAFLTLAQSSAVLYAPLKLLSLSENGYYSFNGYHAAATAAATGSLPVAAGPINALRFGFTNGADFAAGRINIYGVRRA